MRPLRRFLLLLTGLAPFASVYGIQFNKVNDNTTRLYTAFIGGNQELDSYVENAMYCWFDLDSLYSGFNSPYSARPDFQWPGDNKGSINGPRSTYGRPPDVNRFPHGRDVYCATFIKHHSGPEPRVTTVDYSKYYRPNLFNLTQDRYDLSLKCTNTDLWAKGNIQISVESQTLTKVNVHYTISGSPNTPTIMLNGTPWPPNNRKYIRVGNPATMEVAMECWQKQLGSYQWQLTVYASVP